MNLNVKNRTIFCRDNIDILHGINSNSIDLVYLDPPFNKKKEFTAPTGTSAEGASFMDIFKKEDIKDEWVSRIYFENLALHTFLTHTKTDGIGYNYCYLVYMAIRLIECRRVLKDTGSIYLHCDPTMSHYLKIVMDSIFGEGNFRNEITWKRVAGAGKSSQHQKRRYGANSDIILFYTKSNEYSFNPFRELTTQETTDKFKLIDENENRYYDDSSHIYRPQALGERPNLCYEWRGFVNRHSSGWVMSKERLEEEYQKGNIVIIDRKIQKGNMVINDRRIQRRKYLKDYEGLALSNFWEDINNVSGNERTGYPTQKPLELLERIIKASSSKGDVVLDPFCGCATTCVAAEKLDRYWIGIDISHKAYDLVNERMEKEVYRDLFEIDKKAILTTMPPVRDESIKDEEKGYVYVISNPKYGAVYKVGIAKNLKSRLSSYQTSDPDRAFKVEYKVKCTNYTEIEIAVHKHFNIDRDHEWVYADKDEIINIIKGMVR